MGQQASNSGGFPLDVQARWVEQTLFLLWKAGASAAVDLQIGDTADRPTVHAGFQSGVYFSNGQPKPSSSPSASVRHRADRQEKIRAWGKAPAGGTLRIERLKGGQWVTIRQIQVGAGAVFVAKLKLRGKHVLRAELGGNQSLAWYQGRK